MNRQLAELALDTSSDGRSELLERLTDEVLVKDPPSEREFEIFMDIARVLLREARVESRAAFAAGIVSHDNAPTDVLVSLARDDLTVAAPVLRANCCLSEEALVDLAGSLSLAHLAVLAGRRPLSEPITDVMVGRGDNDVLKALSENGEASLSRASLDRLAKLAQSDGDLCKALASRDDLPPDVAERLVERMARLLAQSVKRGGEAAPVAPPGPARAQLRPPIAAMMADIRAGKATADQIVRHLADKDKGNDIAGLLAALGGLDEMQVFKVLVRKDCAGISTVVKGLGFDTETWDHLVQHRKRRLRLNSTEVKFETADFERRSHAESRTTVEQFQVRRAG